MFHLTEEQKKKLTEWSGKQFEKLRAKWFIDTKQDIRDSIDNCPAELRQVDVQGIRFAYTFIPSSLGMIVKVKDLMTNEEVDLTDYENW